MLMEIFFNNGTVSLTSECKVKQLFAFCISCYQSVVSVLDPALVFQASLANSRLLQAVAQPSVTSLLQDGNVVVALATLLYAPGNITEVGCK